MFLLKVEIAPFDFGIVGFRQPPTYQHTFFRGFGAYCVVCRGQNDVDRQSEVSSLITVVADRVAVAVKPVNVLEAGS